MLGEALRGQPEHGVEHTSRQRPRKRVLLAGMIGADEQHTPGQVVPRSMVKHRGRLGNGEATLPAAFQVVVESDLAQRNDDPYSCERVQLLSNEGTARVKLFGERFVSRGSATDHGADVAVRQVQSVVPVSGRGLVRESKPMQRLIEPVSASIAGEHAAGPVAPMRGGGQAQHVQLRVSISKSWNWPTPVGPVSILPSFRLCHGLTVGHQSWTSGTLNNAGIEQAQQ